MIGKSFISRDTQHTTPNIRQAWPHHILTHVPLPRHNTIHDHVLFRRMGHPNVAGNHMVSFVRVDYPMQKWGFDVRCNVSCVQISSSHICGNIEQLRRSVIGHVYRNRSCQFMCATDFIWTGHLSCRSLPRQATGLRPLGTCRCLTISESRGGGSRPAGDLLAGPPRVLPAYTPAETRAVDAPKVTFKTSPSPHLKKWGRKLGRAPFI